MSTRKTTLFYGLLIAVSSLAVGMVIASRLDLAPTSAAQTFAAPALNSAPISGPIDAQTFRNIAKAQQPMVVNIRTEAKARGQDLSDFFGGQSPDDFFHRFFQGPDSDDQPQQGPQGRKNPRQSDFKDGRLRPRLDAAHVSQEDRQGHAHENQNIIRETQPRRLGNRFRRRRCWLFHGLDRTK